MERVATEYEEGNPFMKITTPGKATTGKDIVRQNLLNKITNFKNNIEDSENLRREVLFILDRYPNHREWKTVAGFQAKNFLETLRSEVRASYSKSNQPMPSFENLVSDMIHLANKQFEGRLSMLHISLETSEVYLEELKNL